MGLLMYYLLEHRGLRQPVVTTSTRPRWSERLGERYGVPVLRDARRLQVRRPEDDRDRRDDGRRGVGRLRLRDAPARARRHLRRPDAARPLPAGARAPVAGRCPMAVDHLHEIAGPSFYLRIDVHVDAGRPTRRSRSGSWSSSAENAPPRSAGQPVVRTDAPRRRTTASSSAPPTARGCWCASAARSRSCASTPSRPPRRPPTRSSRPARRSSRGPERGGSARSSTIRA